MTDEWAPDNLPIMLLNRALITSTSKPIKIGAARLTNSDKDALLAIDVTNQSEVDRQQALMDMGVNVPARDSGKPDEQSIRSRYAVGADWIQDITDLPYQVSYYFPSSAHSNKLGKDTYGEPGMTNRVLYELLCQGFNGGRRFIEDYFSSVFERHMRPQYEVAVRGLKQRIADEAQKRRKQKKMYIANFAEWTSPMTAETFSKLGKRTKDDIVQSLSTGLIPLRMRQLSPRTLAIRARLGILDTAVFYATGRLINSIVVSVILLDPSTAQKAGITEV